MNKLTHSNTKKSQVISLNKVRAQNRNKHISSLIDSIQDDGPAILNSKKKNFTISTKKIKTPLVMITRTAEKATTPPSAEPQIQSIEKPMANQAVKPARKNSLVLPMVLMISLFLSASFFVVNSLNTRITTLEQQINTLVATQTLD